MVKSCSRNKNIFLLTIILVGILFVFATQPLSAQQILQPASTNIQGINEPNGSSNDFDNDVRLGLQNLVANSQAQIQQKEIQSQDHQSTWDEFGMNVLVDGASLPNEISKDITQNILQTVQTEMNYDKQEETYLQANQITPQEIQTIEGSTASDILPGQSTDPNPSLETNPDASVSSVESLGQNSNEANSLTQEGATQEQSQTENTSNAQSQPTSDTSANTPTTTENTIFDAILQGEQNNPPAEATPPPAEATPSPSEAPPTEMIPRPAGAPPAENPTPAPSSYITPKSLVGSLLDLFLSIFQR